MDDFEQLFQIFPRWFLAGQGPKEDGKLRDEVFVLQEVSRNAAGIDGGVVKEFEPILRLSPIKCDVSHLVQHLEKVIY